ncbi:hypothetical protein BpHYR1_024525 [Brachionus plicatilis]|uniref:Uncharacterized protein n=1 Tax=Brachionus plicatilis TaxID=10195 RepID=A0A3M7RB42_BRAPC|nr:hypothetical protein BpHYR1_024525 [Brachionus plicatilis]
MVERLSFHRASNKLNNTIKEALSLVKYELKFCFTVIEYYNLNSLCLRNEKVLNSDIHFRSNVLYAKCIRPDLQNNIQLKINHKYT